MNELRIEDIYQEILDGKRANFPYYIWSESDNKQFARRVAKYLIEVILNWDTEEIKKVGVEKLLKNTN
ncbi:hypothetical protein P4V74_30085 [Bacillus thuringiensis]|nr:hypothetical protein [Bacillus thuringiensis]